MNVQKQSNVRVCFSIVVLVVIFMTSAVVANEFKMPLLWKTNQKTLLESAPIVADINNDSRDEVVLAGREEIIALGKSGQELWRSKASGRFMTYPTVLQRREKSALIYAADWKGQMTCFDGKDGSVVWKQKLNAGVEWSACVIGDIDAHGKQSVIQTDAKGTVWSFDAFTGDVLWSSQVSGNPVSPAIGDLDGDGKREIVIMTNAGNLFALSSGGDQLWNTKIGEPSEIWATSAPVIFAASDGSTRIVASSSDGLISCLDENGADLWSFSARGPVASSISVSDFDGNGIADIFLITQTGFVYRLDETGALVWEINMQGRSLASGAIIDINNDGDLEYVLSTQRGHLLVYDQNGAAIFDHQFDNRTINVTPAFGDVTRSNKDLEMVISGGESGQTFCFGTPALKSSQREWTSYRGDVKNSGAWFGLASSKKLSMIPKNVRSDLLFSGEPVKFEINNPLKNKELHATAECVRPDGARQTATAKIIAQRGVLALPIDVTTAGIYTFTWMLKNSNGKRLLSESRELFLQPFSNDRAVVTRSISTLRETAVSLQKTLPLSAEALRERAQELEIGFEQLLPQQEAAVGVDSKILTHILKQTGDLTQDAKKALQMSDVISRAKTLGQGASLIAFEGEKWDNRNVISQMPTIIENPLQLEYDVVPGEHQPVSLLLFNITNRPLNVRLEMENDDKKIQVMPLHSIATPTSLGEMSWDALPELDQSSVITIPSLSSRELWLDIKMDDDSVGLQHVNVTLQALNGAGVLEAPTNPHPVAFPETKVDIAMNVLPFDMAPAHDFRLCTWSPSTGPEVEDLLAHGNNVFLLNHGKIEYDGDFIKNVDFSDLEHVVQQFIGVDVFFLLRGFPGIKHEFGSELYKRDFADYIPRLVQALERLGIDKNHYALYPIDEPGVHGWDYVNKMVDFGMMVRAVDPDVMIYMDGYGELPMFEAMSKCMDVWVPPVEWLPEQSPEMHVMRTTGKLMWSYNCSYISARPVGPNIKNMNLIAEFRTAALLAMRHDATGIGYWCYNAGRENPWGRIQFEYNLVYPGRTKPVTSRRWEAVREGIEDYRILASLKSHMENSQLAPDLKKRIDKLLNHQLPDLVDPGARAMKLGLSRAAIGEAYSEEKMNAFRIEMMECVKDVVAEK